MSKPTYMRLPCGDSVDLLGGTRITVLKSADRHPDYFALRLQRTLDEQEVEDPLPEPAQEEPLQGKRGESPPCEGRVGSAGPLPDALPQEGEVVEGVGGDAQDDLGEREVAFFSAIRDAVDDLQFAYCGARAANCGEGNLILSNDTLQASVVWSEGGDLRLSLSSAMPGVEGEGDLRP